MSKSVCLHMEATLAYVGFQELFLLVGKGFAAMLKKGENSRVKTL